MKKAIRVIKPMRKHEAERLVNKLNNGTKEWLQEKFNNRAPRFAEWRQGIPKECLTKNFKAFANRLMIAGFELKNAFSIYSKLVLVAPEFVNRYITEGPVIKRTMTGEWNLRELIEAHYGISESVYRIIEQEKCPDKLGTIRSGFEALQAIFIKGCRLGGASGHSDYIINGVKYDAYCVEPLRSSPSIGNNGKYDRKENVKYVKSKKVYVECLPAIKSNDYMTTNINQ